MTALAISNLLTSDDNQPLTLESTWQKYANFSGIQKLEFLDLINTFDSSKWTTASGISYGNSISVTSSPSSEKILWYSDNMPHSFVYEFTVHQSSWAVVVRGDGNNNYYRVNYRMDTATPTAAIVSGSKWSSGVQSGVVGKELTSYETYSGARVKVSVRDEQYTSDSPGRLIHIAVYLNDRMLFVYEDNVASQNPPLQFGFVIPASNPTGTVYSDLRIANLNEVIQWSSLDPSENPSAAIQRAIEDRYIRSWIRWNGQLKAYKPVARSNVFTIDQGREFSLSPIRDRRQLFSHLRILGAFQWVQSIDPDLIRAYGNQFAELQNTSTWNADDCEDIATNMFVRMKEQAYQAQVQTYGLILLELEDRFQVSDTNPNNSSPIDYIVDQISYQSVNDTFEVTIVGRQYYYGNP